MLLTDSLLVVVLGCSATVEFFLSKCFFFAVFSYSSLHSLT